MALAFAEMARLEGRVAEMVGVVNASTAGLVSLLSEALATDAWQVDGIRSPEHWVAWQTGASARRAKGLVAMAEKLPSLPATREAFERGELSEDQVRLICAVVDPRNDQRAADLGRVLTVTQLAKALRPLAQPAPPPPEKDGPPPPQEEERRVSFGYDDDGQWWLRARLPGDEGALVEKALQQARDAEFRLRHPEASEDDAGAARDGVTWADGLVRMAEAALNDLAPNGRPGDRYQVLIHVPADGDAAAHLHLGPSIDAATQRHHECDATVRHVLEQDGRIVALSRKQHTVDDKTRALVEHRDGGCRVPACGQTRWLHIHHIRHWRDGGPTTLDNLCALCPTHHRMHHHGRLRIEGDPTTTDGLTFRDSRGRIIGPSPPRPPGRRPREAARDLGLPDPTWEHPTGERVDWRWIWWH